MKSTSPDITLASLNLLPYTSWHTHTTLGSDHLPIIVTLVTDLQRTPSDNRTFTNFKKADWQKFTEDTEIEFSKQQTPPDIYKGEKIFREILNKAAKNSIPSGRIKNVYPQVPTEAANKIRERDTLRKTEKESSPSNMQTTYRYTPQEPTLLPCQRLSMPTPSWSWPTSQKGSLRSRQVNPQSRCSPLTPKRHSFTLR